LTKPVSLEARARRPAGIDQTGSYSCSMVTTAKITA